ncbi:unnamed protein product [Blepharisma stoltei]|uniref:G-protein coupled receptors family 3 profile domain-containing protein n=1 Tax=Blepharisma stoltei TaxID=1481888 RepID=A0AAU9KA41_9CILI|nr:unnamed protein product [Blepharisma stoltei]
MLFYILSAILCAIYLAIWFLLLYRSKKPQIRSRSPTLLYISHLANLIEVILILPTATSLQDGEDSNKVDDNLWKLRQCGLVLAHYLVYLPYILRCFRLYYLFKLDNINDPNEAYKKNLNKIKRKWLLKWLFIGMIPVLILCIVLLAYNSAVHFLPIADEHDSGTQEAVAGGIYVLVCFIEQLVLIMMVFSIRNINDDFNMTSELIFVAVLWQITPMSSIFAQSDGGRWLVPTIFRDVAIMIRSSIIPIILTYTTSETNALTTLTLEMLDSLDLILQNDECFQKFYAFLVKEDRQSTVSRDIKFKGEDLLQFYIKCVICLHEQEQRHNYDELQSFFDKHGDFIVEEITDSFAINQNLDISTVIKAKNAAFNKLQLDYYPKFKDSTEYNILTKMVVEQQIYMSRATDTSLLCIGERSESDFKAYMEGLLNETRLK